MIEISLAILVWLLLVFLTAPWWTMSRVAWAAVTTKTVPIRVRLHSLFYLLSDACVFPLRELAWKFDEVLLRGYKKEDLQSPLFIVGQPRSGTTFFHRTVAADVKNFFAVTYLEWHFPYIWLWSLLDLLEAAGLNLRYWLDKRSYWPDTPVGHIAAKMHPHTFGDFEEHGVFLEEHFYTHFFVFRRFPFPSILEYMNPSGEGHMADRLIEVAKKVAHYRGYGRRWVTKENECIGFYDLLMKRLPSAKLAFVVRDRLDVLQSYDRLSVTSTHAKTGVDPIFISGWWEANRHFRYLESMEFWGRLDFFVAEQSARFCIIKYEEFAVDPLSSVQKLYSRLGLEVDPLYEVYLKDLAFVQGNRVRGY